MTQGWCIGSDQQPVWHPDKLQATVANLLALANGCPCWRTISALARRLAAIQGAPGFLPTAHRRAQTRVESSGLAETHWAEAGAMNRAHSFEKVVELHLSQNDRAGELGEGR